MSVYVGLAAATQVLQLGKAFTVKTEGLLNRANGFGMGVAFE